MTISRVQVHGYQSLHDLDIELDSFTLIVGESDSGKSAFIRALRGWAQNQSGDSFVTVGRKSSSVKVSLDDGSEVTWNKPANEYLLGDGLTHRTFSKAGRTVPDEIREHTGFVDVVFDEDYSDLINFASQFDPPFLLTESGTRIAKVFGKLSGTEYIYNAQRLAAKDIQNAKSDLAAAQSQLSYAQNELLKYTDLDDQLKELSQLKTVVGRAETFLQETESLQNDLTSYFESKAQCSEIEHQLSELPEEIDLAKLESALDSLQQLYEVYLSYTDLLAYTESVESELREALETYQKSERQLADFKSSFSICPFCERVMDHAH